MRQRLVITGLFTAAAIAVLGVGGAWYFGAPPPSKTTAAVAPRVDVISPRRDTLAQRLQTNATLEAFEESDLYAKISGFVSQVLVDIGDRIEAGQVLAEIDVPELQKELAEAEAQLESRKRSAESTQRQVEHNKADLALQEVTLKRQESLASKGAGRYVSDQSVDEAKAKAEVSRADLAVAEANSALAAAQVDLATATVEKTKAMLGYSHILAPFDGVVSQRLANRGDLVQAATSARTTNTPLFKVHRIDIIRVFCDVPEDKVAQVRIGDPAIVKPIGIDGAQFIGTVTRFAARLDPQTRNMRTEIDLPNVDGRLYPGMYAEVSLEMNRHPDVLTVPVSAIGTEGRETFVYAVSDNRIERVPVELGQRDGSRAEVTKGLSEHTSVVTVARTAPPPGTAVQTNGGTF